MPALRARPSSRTTLRLSLACDFAQVRPTARTIRDLLRERDVASSVITACEMALVEACNNAIEYAGATGRRKPVLVQVRIEAAQVELRVTDRTPGFEWPKTVALPAPDCEGGRGLFVIHSMMDFADYLRGNGENVLVMRKSLSTQRRSASHSC